MPAEQIAKLTDKEREALRLVYAHHTSKEIGRKLGISEDAVDGRLRSARRKLGVQNSTKAAVLLAEHERRESYGSPVYTSPEIAPGPPGGMIEKPVASRLLEAQKPFLIDVFAPAAEASAPAPHEEEQRNRLGPWQRMGAIAAIGIGTILSIGALVSALNGLVQLALSRAHLF